MKPLGEKKLHHTNRYLQIVLAFVLLGGGVGPISAASAPVTTLHDAAAQLTKELNGDPDVQKIIGERIVIAPFENINGKGDAVPRILQEMFTTDFIKTKHFKVLERDQLQSALTELHFQLSDLSDPAKAKKIGKLVGAAYVLLGSISDTGTSTSINARIVSIESGESVAAEDEDINTSDAPLAASGLNPALTTSAPPVTAPPVTAPTDNTPAIDLNANATPTTAGQFTGKKDNFGLLGGTGFKIAWREDLGKDPVHAFSAGDVLGDGTTRFVEYMASQDRTDTSFLRISKWEDGNLSQKWQSENFQYDTSVNCIVCVSHTEHKPGFITLSSNMLSVYVQAAPMVWRWDGSTYSNALERNTIDAPVLGWLSSFEFLSTSSSGFCLRSADKGVETLTSSNPPSLSFAHSINGISTGIPTAGYFDGHGSVEVATPEVSDIKQDGSTIGIWGTNGRRAVTTKKYGGRLTTWNPAASKYPYIVARKNPANEQGESNGGFVYFIRWNGENYDEVWHSNKIDDEVIDMQVCDPKSEGKAGLVILSRQDKNYFLTKIVLAK